MRSNHPLSLSAAVLAGTLALSLPAMAQQAQPAQGQQGQSQPTPQAQQPGQQDPIVSTMAGNAGVRVGADVVDAVDDMRESVDDLIGALIDAREGFSVSGWNDMELRLQAMQQELQQMEQTLDRKARKSDQEWSTWMSAGDYNVQVTQQVQKVGEYLNQIATMITTLKENQTGTPIVVGEELVDQVEEVREAVSEMVDALAEAGPQFGWTDGEQRFTQVRQRLQQMEQELATKANQADEAWSSFIASPEYRTTIHDNLSALASIVNDLFPQGS